MKLIPTLRRLTPVVIALPLLATTAGFERKALADDKKQVAAAGKSQQLEYFPLVERGVGGYEREKTQGNPGPAAFNPLSVGIAYALIDRATADKFPLITINHGRTDTTDGAVFPYVFPLLLNPWSEASALVNYIGLRDGGLDKLKGKQIVVLYHGSPYGKETIPIFKLLSEKYGFTVTEIEVPHPGNEQQSQ
jgi:branched-chain amino acid transport system substrate-binding protein